MDTDFDAHPEYYGQLLQVAAFHLSLPPPPPPSLLLMYFPPFIPVCSPLLFLAIDTLFSS